MLADVPLTAPAFAEEVFGPVAPVTRVSSAEEAAKLAATSEYGLSLGIVTRDVMRGLAVAEQIPTGIVHINDQTVNDEANAPFGGVRASGTGSRFGGAARPTSRRSPRPAGSPCAPSRHSTRSDRGVGRTATRGRAPARAGRTGSRHPVSAWVPSTMRSARRSASSVPGSAV
ncbi:aldehyde dehydrogenase family protein [Nonomuraea polychroma]|uniref:aldehyde dehydrogenase family protein n=1 Tax=Nonomuraea polychroma TaxID=46176 RepID=UPI003D939522